MRLLGKHALVTGGGRGIGRAIALAMAREGANVAVACVADMAAAAAVAETVRTLNRRAVALRADLACRDEVDRLVAEATAALGPIDILVSNAGTLTRRPFLELPDEEFDRVIAVDLKGPFLLGQSVARQLVDRGSAGSIINISSISDQHAYPGLTHYQCAKAGLTMLTRSMALELAPHGIRVNAIAPGVTATDINRSQWAGQPDIWQARESRIPLGRAGRPEDHAGAAVFLASNEAAWITGTTIIIDGGQTTT